MSTMTTTRSVSVLHWPQDNDQRETLQELGVACLWLVDPSAVPPQTIGSLEDWARSSADPIEIHTRISSLSDRVARATRSIGSSLSIDENGLLWCNDEWVSLGAIEARLAERLIADFGRMVSHRQLVEACWEAEPPSRALEQLVLRLRRHVRPLGLAVHNIRGHGYALADA